ncbi:PocR ligand-binding domain-containing protein [Candidatus Desantisbacteria bacterium]|nr:PocR ligand-binding domain-containing protein [Candidatus Desantisbacteria bacterium]
MVNGKGFNKNEKVFWEKILSEFTDITGLEANIVDPKGQVLVKTFEDEDLPRYCSLIRSTEKGRNGCLNSYAALAKKVIKTRQPQVEECHAKLINMGIPFTVSNKKDYVIIIHHILGDRIGKQHKDFIAKLAKELKLKKADLESCLKVLK